MKLVLFEQAIGCDSCAAARRVVDDLVGLSPNVTREVLNLVIDKDRAAALGVDRVPAVVVSGPAGNRMRFYGAPTGYELASLAAAIELTAGGSAGLAENTRARLSAVTKPVQIQVFFTPSCVYCPQMVVLACRFAVESPFISAIAIDATEYPDLVQRYRVNGVPKTVINDAAEIVGAAGEDLLVDAVLEAVATTK